MKFKIIVAVLLVSLKCTAQLAPEWYNYPGGTSIATDANINVYTIDWDMNPAGDISITKRDSAGSILWLANYDNQDVTRHEVATWVETDYAENIIVTGTIRSGFSNPVIAASLVMKFDSAGVMLWRNVFESTFEGTSTRKCIIDKNNNIYILGTGIGTTGTVTRVKKYDSNGNAIWSYLDTDGIGVPTNFKFGQDSSILISGRGLLGSINGYAKIDTAGNKIWSLPGINSLTPGDIAGDTNGNSFIVNGEYSSFSPGTIVQKLNATGGLVWSDTCVITGYRVETGTDQLPVLCGMPPSGSGGAAFVKYDANGSILWQNLDADGPQFNLLLHAQLKLDQNNAAYLAAGTLTGMAICKVNSNGGSEWLGIAPGSYANRFSIGADNNIYVVGGTTAKFGNIATKIVEASQSNINIYPNPFSDKITITSDYNMGNVLIIITDLKGRLIKKQQLENTEMSFLMTDLSPGTYLLQVTSEKTIITKKIVKM